MATPVHKLVLSAVSQAVLTCACAQQPSSVTQHQRSRSIGNRIRSTELSRPPTTQSLRLGGPECDKLGFLGQQWLHLKPIWGPRPK
jgi:hypothetical protein